MTTNDEEQKEKWRVIAFDCLLYLFVKHLESWPSEFWIFPSISYAMDIE